MNAAQRAVVLHDLEPPADDFRREVLDGLTRRKKTIPCKFFYDQRGARLFEDICELDEYYVTRTETMILTRYIDEIAARLGPECRVIEFGNGASAKTRILLDHLDHPAAYIPIDISKLQLLDASSVLARAYPDLDVMPVCADYTRRVSLPVGSRPVRRTVVFFPGSTIGNFRPPEAERFLRRVAALCGPGGGLLIGVDLKKDETIVHAAYNDRAGVTAAFNLNLLGRINREFPAAIPIDQFRHDAIYRRAQGRIEMHLVSRRAQRIRLNGSEVWFEAGERITTEYSYKYQVDEFPELAARAGFDLVKAWTDDRRWFSVQYLMAAAER